MPEQTSLPLEDFACVDEFISPKMRQAGVKCPCRKHSPYGPEELPRSESQKPDAPPEEATLGAPPRRIPWDAIRDGEENKQD